MEESKQKKVSWHSVVRIIVILASMVVSFFLLFIIVSAIISKPIEQRKDSTPETAKVDQCKRSESYQMAPEFERAVSIIKQKMVLDGGFLDKFENCLDIQYGQLKDKNEGPEGVFMFDSSVSSGDDLKILVDNSYKNEDDYMTAVLLVHEITHAKQFYENTNLSCVDIEVHAFWNEFVLLTKLNDGEKKSITARMYNPLGEASLPIKALDNLIETVKVADAQCKGDKVCTQNESAKLLKKQIESSPYYQKQCGK